MKCGMTGRSTLAALPVILFTAAILIPGTALADTLLPLSPVTLPATLVIMVVEAIGLALFFKRTVPTHVPFLSLLWTSVVANFVSSLFGVILYFHPGLIMTFDFSIAGLILMLFGLIMSTLIEWIVYMILRREPYLAKSRLLLASLVANAVSHVMLVGFLIGASISGVYRPPMSI